MTSIQVVKDAETVIAGCAIFVFIILCVFRIYLNVTRRKQ